MAETGEQNQWRAALLAKPSEKSWWTAFFLSLFLGLYGIDRMYVGFLGLGILKLLTMGGIGVWWIADLIFLCSNKMRDSHGNIIQRPF